MKEERKCQDCDWVKHPITDCCPYCNQLKYRVWRYSRVCPKFRPYFEPF